MNRICALILTCCSLYTFCQNSNPFFEVNLVREVNENDLLAKDDSLKALIININGENYENAINSIINNNQLKGIKVNNPTTEFLSILSNLQPDSLKYLIIENYARDSLILPGFSKLIFFEINSDSLRNLNLSYAKFTKIETLNIDASRLIDLKTETEYPFLDILNLHAPYLIFFPFEKTPKLNYLSLKSSLNEIPTCFCNNDNLIGILIWNYGPIKIDSCLKRKIKFGFESSLIVYKDLNGQILNEIYSK